MVLSIHSGLHWVKALIPLEEVFISMLKNTNTTWRGHTINQADFSEWCSKVNFLSKLWFDLFTSVRWRVCNSKIFCYTKKEKKARRILLSCHKISLFTPLSPEKPGCLPLVNLISDSLMLTHVGRLNPLPTSLLFFLLNLFSREVHTLVRNESRHQKIIYYIQSWYETFWSLICRYY